MCNYVLPRNSNSVGLFQDILALFYFDFCCCYRLVLNLHICRNFWCIFSSGVMPLYYIFCIYQQYVQQCQVIGSVGLCELAHSFFHDNRDICITGYNILLKIRRILFKTELLHGWTLITVLQYRVLGQFSLSLSQKRKHFFSIRHVIVFNKTVNKTCMI